MPIKDVSKDWSGRRNQLAALKSQVVKGKGLTCVVVASFPTKSREGRWKNRVLRILLDSGSEGDLAFVPKGDLKNYSLTERAYPQQWGTSDSEFTTKYMADMELLFPEFSENKILSLKPDVKVCSTGHKPVYDVIIGVETLASWGVMLNFRTRTIDLDGLSIPMKDKSELASRRSVYNIYREATEPHATKEETARVTKILDAKYEPADLPRVVNENCPHLSHEQKAELLKLLEKHESMFQGKLGCWDDEFVHFELKPDAKPYRGRPYPVPRIHRDTIMTEITRLLKLGVLEKIEESEWGSPSFIIPKGNNQVRFLTDFRELNKRILRKPYPLPKIQDMLQQMESFTFASAIDLNMGYYHLRLSPATREICAIVFPWGVYRYNRLPMGACCAPDIFQAKMSSLFAELNYVQAYLDDLLVITSDTFEDHLEKLDLVLTKMRNKGLQVNAAKSKFAAQEIDYLGYHLTTDGISPQQSKVSAILALKPPNNVKQLRRVLGIIQYYRDIWHKRTDLLAPLTDLVGECGTSRTSKKGSRGKRAPPWRWDEEHQEAFESIKKVIARDVVLAYPSFGDEFVIYTDASTRQLGGVITQNNRPIAFFSRKLTAAQTRYTVTELELLSIVELLKEFKGMLLGQKLTVYTDHKNLVQKNLGSTSDRVMRWMLLIQEFDVDIRYIKGEDNTVADAISRLDYNPKLNPHPEDEVDEDGNWRESRAQRKWNNLVTLFCHYRDDDSGSDEEDAPLDTKEVFAHVFAQSAAEDDEIYPVTIREIADEQRKDPKLKDYFKGKGKDKDIKPQYLEDTLVLIKPSPSKRPRLVIPTSLQPRVLAWYHHYLQHPGRDRMEETLARVMYWAGMRTQIRRLVRNCVRCQKGKSRKRKYGHVPAKEAVTQPWHTVCVDLIGPKTLKAKYGVSMDFMCLTMIDPASGWFEIVELPTIRRATSARKKKKEEEFQFDTSSATISHLFNKVWLSRYPRPRYVVCDNGSEFKLHLKELCREYSMKRRPTTSKNPQANAILERIHAVFGDMLRTSGINNSEELDEHQIDQFISNAAWAIRSTYHTVLKATPGEAIFGRDMLFDIPYIADWDEIGRRRQERVDKDNARENRKRLHHDYVVGDKCLLINEINNEKRPKADDKHDGPYLITQVYTNGTVRIQRGTINERINIRRLTPFFEDGEE